MTKSNLWPLFIVMMVLLIDPTIRTVQEGSAFTWTLALLSWLMLIGLLCFSLKHRFSKE